MCPQVQAALQFCLTAFVPICHLSFFATLLLLQSGTKTVESIKIANIYENKKLRPVRFPFSVFLLKEENRKSEPIFMSLPVCKKHILLRLEHHGPLGVFLMYPSLFPLLSIAFESDNEK